jgi:phosphohistidine phosphatase
MNIASPEDVPEECGRADVYWTEETTGATMALYLVRHGEAAPKEIKSDRPLSDRGLTEVRHVAELAAKKDVVVTKIFHSGKKRAMQTALIFQEYLKPASGIAETEGMNPKDDISGILVLIENKDNIMLVGHLPFLEKLASHLVAGNQDRRIVEFPTAGMVCLEKEHEEGTWKILWKLMP